MHMGQLRLMVRDSIQEPRVAQTLSPEAIRSLDLQRVGSTDFQAVVESTSMTYSAHSPEDQQIVEGTQFMWVMIST
jgi:hypothetical protein